MRHFLDIIRSNHQQTRCVWYFCGILIASIATTFSVSGQANSTRPTDTFSTNQQVSKTALVKSYYDQCYQYYRAEQHDSVIVIADQGIQLAIQNDLTFLEAQLLETKALSYEFLDIDQSISVYLQAIEAYERAGHPNWIDEVKFEGVGNAHTILIRMYARKGDMSQAMHHYEIIESIVEEHQYYTRKAMYESMAFAQAFAGDFEEAIRYFKLSIGLSRQASEASGEVVRGLEENYALIASYFQEIEQPDSAFQYIQSAIKIAKDTIQSRIRGRAMVNRIAGTLYLETGNIDSAALFLNKAFEEYQFIGDIAELSHTAAPLSRCFLQMGQLEEALDISKKSVLWADHSRDLTAIQGSLRSRYTVLTETGRLLEAIEINNRLDSVSSAISSRQNHMLTEAFAKRYESSEKQNQIELQEERIGRQRTLLYAGGIISLLLLVISFMAYRVALHRKKTNQLLTVQRDQLAQLDVAKSNFFANVSHELKTPLTLILAPLRNALEKSKNLQLNKDLNRAHKNGEKLLGLVNELLDLSKLENGQLQITNIEVNLHQLVKRITSSFASMSDIRKIQIELHYELNPDTYVSIDSEKLEKILTNLISNAIKFSKAQSTVTVGVRKLNDINMELTIEDQGKGIHPDEQQKIFQRYYQSNHRSAVQGGTGIGLALVSELVELMGGSVNVKSTLGSGSLFTITLPFTPTGAVPSVIDEMDETKYEEKAKDDYIPTIIFDSVPKILIIEDDLEMSQFLVDILSTHFHCSTAFNGNEGLDQLALGQFDCVTCDVMMPEMDGFEFIKTLRAKELYERTPVMMLTARTLEEDLLRGFSLGVDDYVAKPFSKHEVIARVNALIVNKNARDQWRSEEGVQEEKIESFEVKQIKSAEDFILSNLSDPSIKVKDLADHMNYSVRQITRIIKKLTGLSPNNFIKEVRLQKAHFLINTRQFATIAEVRHEVGFSNSSYFSKAFLERFGVRPGEL